jgi:hypothetical protein
MAEQTRAASLGPVEVSIAASGVWKEEEELYRPN